MLRLLSAWFLGICLMGAAQLPVDLPLGKPYKSEGVLVAMKAGASLHDLGQQTVGGVRVNVHTITVDGFLRGVYVVIPKSSGKEFAAYLTKTYGPPTDTPNKPPLLATWDLDGFLIGFFFDQENNVFRVAFLAPPK